jgi:hypothetical protein
VLAPLRRRLCRSDCHTTCCRLRGIATTPTSAARAASSPTDDPTSSASESAGVVSNTIVPIPPNAVLPDTCTGESVLVTGRIHVVTVATLDAGGGTHTLMHFNVQGVSGVGLTSGTRYRGIHTETVSANSSGAAPSEFTTKIDIKLISAGESSNLTIRDVLLHVTVNAAGETTASIDKLTTGECQ